MANGKSSGKSPGKSPTDRPNQARPSQARTVYSEFGSEFSNATHSDALERAEPDLPPNQQNVRVQASRAGRKGKTVTVITGFQTSPETLAALLKQLKAQCGSGGTLKDNTIEIQGDHKQKILQILVQLGYRAKISGG
jgi:translation initiation factor 1